jgi:hypothetical protein
VWHTVIYQWHLLLKKFKLRLQGGRRNQTTHSWMRWHSIQ